MNKNTKVTIIITIIIIIFLYFSTQFPHELFSVDEYYPYPLVLYKSQDSHKAPIWPIKHDASPSIHPPKQFEGKLKQ